MFALDAPNISAGDFPPAIEITEDTYTALGVDLSHPDIRIAKPERGRVADSDTSNLLIDEDQTEVSNISRLNELVFYYSGPRSAHEEEIRRKAELSSDAKKRFSARLRSLQDEAATEGLQINVESRKDFVRFINNKRFLRSGSLALLDNGNLKATWKAGVGERVTLEFRGGGRAHHVIFTRRAMQQAISRSSGEDTLDGIEAQIHALDVNDLLSA